MSNPFEKIAGAKVNKGGVFYIPGSYTSAIDALKMTKNYKGHDCFVAETEVLESTNPERPKGSKPSVVLNLTSNEMAAGDALALVAAAMGLDPSNEAELEKITEDVVAKVTGPDNPLRGQRIHINATNIKVGKGLPEDQKRDFTKLVYSPVVETAEAA
jgi:hypothetical protein